jgi:hypothetical protein
VESSLLYTRFHQEMRAEATVPEKLERQIEAIKLQQSWSIWLVTAQLAVLAVVAATAIGQPSGSDPGKTP